MLIQPLLVLSMQTVIVTEAEMMTSFLDSILTVNANPQGFIEEALVSSLSIGFE
jgi:hypothetical protein